MTERPISEDELHAYVDGELPSDRRAAVEAWLAINQDDRGRVAAWRSQMDAIRAHFGNVATEPLPPRINIDKLMRAGHRGKQFGMAAAALAFVIGATAGWIGRGEFTLQPRMASGFERFTTDALDAHKLYAVEVRHPVEVSGSEQDHLVQWLSKRVGCQLRAPNLEKVGLKLVGGRLLPGPTGAAAFFMYESASGERYTFYMGKSNVQETALRYNVQGSTSAVYWVNDNVAYVVSGESDRSKLQQVAAIAYDQLDAKGSGRSPL
jgi:anti-sigma factor RsiW